MLILLKSVKLLETNIIWKAGKKKDISLFRKIPRVRKHVLRIHDFKHGSLHFMLEYLTLIGTNPAVMTADKSPRIFSRQMEAIDYNSRKQVGRGNKCLWVFSRYFNSYICHPVPWPTSFTVEKLLKTYSFVNIYFKAWNQTQLQEQAFILDGFVQCKSGLICKSG